MIFFHHDKTSVKLKYVLEKYTKFTSKKINMTKIPPHFIVEKEKKVFFLIKGVFPENLILKQYMPYFPKVFKGIIMRCEESFYKMRIKVNS